MSNVPVKKPMIPATPVKRGPVVPQKGVPVKRGPVQPAAPMGKPFKKGGMVGKKGC